MRECNDPLSSGLQSEPEGSIAAIGQGGFIRWQPAVEVSSPTGLSAACLSCCGSCRMFVCVGHRRRFIDMKMRRDSNSFCTMLDCFSFQIPRPCNGGRFTHRLCCRLFLNWRRDGFCGRVGARFNAANVGSFPSTCAAYLPRAPWRPPSPLLTG